MMSRASHLCHLLSAQYLRTVPREEQEEHELAREREEDVACVMNIV